MRVVFDLNVLLDLQLERAPHFENVSALARLVDEGRIVGMVGANTLVALSYVLTRAIGSERAAKAVARILERFEVRSIGRAALHEGLDATVGEYDDAVLYAAARHGRADAIVTRNPENFEPGPVQVYTPGNLVQNLRAKKLEPATP